MSTKYSDKPRSLKNFYLNMIALMGLTFDMPKSGKGWRRIYAVRQFGHEDLAGIDERLAEQAGPGETSRCSKSGI
jgi:hypothetical protein